MYLGRNSFEKGIDILKIAEKNINGQCNLLYGFNMAGCYEIIKSIYCFSAVPSRMESLPTNIKEAFFFKIPVVAANVGGIPELISDNETGILAIPRRS